MALKERKAGPTGPGLVPKLNNLGNSVIFKILFIAFVQDVFDELDGFEYHAVAMGLLFPAAGLIHAQKVRAVETVLMMIQEGFVESGDSRSVFDTQES